MSLKRHAAKRDTNEPDIIAALRAAGASVQPLSEKGCPDLLVAYRGNTLLLEVKMPGKHLTPDQQTFLLAWRGYWEVVRTPAEALRAIGASG